MTQLRRYDPYRHAETLGIAVCFRPLQTCNGMWRPDLREIHLRLGMPRIQERCVLAHELVHAEFDDRGRVAEHERRADRLAARRLIDDDAVRTATRLSEDPGAWALELDVTDHMLRVWLDHRLERHG